MYIYTCTHAHRGILFSHKKWNLAICNNMDGNRKYNANWKKSVRDRPTPYDFIPMWNLRNKANKQRGKERERERGADPSRVWSLTQQHRARSYKPEILTWAKIKSQMFNLLSYPGTPVNHIFKKRQIFKIKKKEDASPKELYWWQISLYKQCHEVIGDVEIETTVRYHYHFLQCFKEN